MTLYLGLLLAYSAGLIGMGLWLGRRVESASAFFVADRRLGALPVFATVLAANIGAGSTMGAAGLGYRDGLSGWWWVGSAGIGTLFLAFWVGPRIWRVATRNGLYTVGDYLELRYGRSVRAIIAALLWVGTPAILAGQLIAMSDIFEVVAGTPPWAGAFVGGVVITIYFTAGGLLTSAWVNLVQLVVLLVGFAVAVPWALGAAGGWGAVAAAAPPTGDYLNFWQGGQSGWMYLALLVPAFVISPGLLQKAYGAIDERAIKVGLGAAGIALLLFAAAPPVLGMIARSLDPALVNPEHALPTVFVLGLPVALGALGLAAVFSAEMSSADAILFMLATSLSKDLYKRFLRPDADEAEVLRVARWAALAGGVIGIGLAVVLPSVIAALSIFYALVGVSLFVPVAVGLYSRRPGVPEALASIVGGVAVLVALRFGLPAGTHVLLNPTLIALAASGLLFGVVFAVRRFLSETPDSLSDSGGPL
ncbi:MAG: sodium:solute symporter family protein [Longimicrobiales bacterium]